MYVALYHSISKFIKNVSFKKENRDHKSSNEMKIMVMIIPM